MRTKVLVGHPSSCSNDTLSLAAQEPLQEGPLRLPELFTLRSNNWEVVVVVEEQREFTVPVPRPPKSSRKEGTQMLQSGVPASTLRPVSPQKLHAILTSPSFIEGFQHSIQAAALHWS
jgi:hypothetical protein